MEHVSPFSETECPGRASINDRLAKTPLSTQYPAMVLFLLARKYVILPPDLVPQWPWNNSKRYRTVTDMDDHAAEGAVSSGQ